jgi:nucleoside-diphosphate-sugar epimerase
MNPVLLTGATGFIGQRLQKTLLDDGTGVLAVVRPSSSHKNFLLDGANRLLADLADSDRLIPAIAGASAVIYCAGSVRGRQLEDFRAANVDGVRSVVNAMNQAGADIPLLLISSLAASRPRISDYANSKYLGELEVKNHAAFPWTIFRPPAVYGPGDKEMLPILKLAHKGFVAPPGPKDQKLSFIHVDDLASAVLSWLKSWDKCTRMIFTLDDGHPGGYNWREIAETVSSGSYRRVNIPNWILFGAGHVNLAISRLLGYAPMLTPGKARELTQTDWVCNNKALSMASGWSPEINLEQGVLSLFETAGNRQDKTQGGPH